MIIVVYFVNIFYLVIVVEIAKIGYTLFFEINAELICAN